MWWSLYQWSLSRRSFQKWMVCVRWNEEKRERKWIWFSFCLVICYSINGWRWWTIQRANFICFLWSSNLDFCSDFFDPGFFFFFSTSLSFSFDDQMNFAQQQWRKKKQINLYMKCLRVCVYIDIYIYFFRLMQTRNVCCNQEEICRQWSTSTLSITRWKKLYCQSNDENQMIDLLIDCFLDHCSTWQ